MARAPSGKAQWAALRGDYAAAGELFRLSGRLDRALEMYQRARQHRPAAEVAAELGEHAVASREYELSGLFLDAAESALRAGDRERAARMFIEAGQARRAAEILEAGGRLSDAAALYDHGGDPLRATQLYLDARLPEKAERTLEAVLRSGTGFQESREVPALAARCGQQLLASGLPERAALWYERAGRPADAARAWSRAGRPAAAIESLLAAGAVDRAVELAESTSPGEVDSRLLADAFRAAGRWAEAASLFLEAGQPGSAAECLERLGCLVEAASAHEAAGDFMAAAAVQERTGDTEAAADLYRRHGALHDAARCYRTCGRLAEAAALYEEARDRLSAAEVLEDLGDADRAIQLLQSIPADDDRAVAASLQLARLLEKKGMDPLAVDHYRRALSAQLPPRQAADTWYLMAANLERNGRFREATQALRRVLALDIHYRDAAARLAALETKSGQSAGPRTPITDRYRIDGELPQLGPGRTLLAWDSVMARPVMLRRLGPETVPEGPATERVLGDVRRTARLHHPVIAAIHEAGCDDQGVYVVEEHVAGQPLKHLLQHEGPLDVPRAVHLLTQLAEALDYAHGLGLLARTIRPDTVFVTPAGDARIVDFGLALRASEGQSPSAAYRPPEAGRAERMDPSSDLFLLGVLTWEMLFGYPPPVPAPGQLDPPEIPHLPERPLPEVLRRVLSECLTPDRAHRMGSAQKLLEELHGTNLLPGALLANRYEIRRELGRGGMGTVFAARDLVLDEPVALKVLAGPLDESTERRFVQEIRLARQINHPNIVRVHTLERWRELRFIVMEYIDGVDLRRWTAGKQPIPLGKALEILAGVAAGLSAAHRLGIVHRDVKPENVLIDPDARPRLVDFGIARQGDIHLTREGLVMGSPAYMAPEQIRGEAADTRADLYALGVLAYFLIAGREPFASENVAEVLRDQLETPPPPLHALRPGVPAPIEELVARLLAKDPNRRPASIFAFLEELAAVRSGMTVVMA